MSKIIYIISIGLIILLNSCIFNKNFKYILTKDYIYCKTQPLSPFGIEKLKVFKIKNKVPLEYESKPISYKYTLEYEDVKYGYSSLKQVKKMIFACDTFEKENWYKIGCFIKTEYLLHNTHMVFYVYVKKDGNLKIYKKDVLICK